MTTSSGHTTAILASKVKGTSVYNGTGDKIGHVEDIVLDKKSDSIMFAVLGFGGVVGVGEKFHPMPWSALTYDENKSGYTVPYSTEQLQSAPTGRLEDLTKHDGAAGSIRDQVYSHYGVQ